MKRFSMYAVIGFILISLTMVEAVHAGMINYNRKGRVAPTPGAAPARGYGKAAAPAAPAATPSKAANTQTPAATTAAATATATAIQWKENPPQVQNWSEKQYDGNKDGWLQPEEVMAFLKDVSNEVDQRGSYAIDSEILKAYDKDGDGFINRAEIASIKNDMKG